MNDTKIQVLSEEMANRIAAGEVVERPASVVKELVENSIDAGADDIRIEIEQAGKRRILVTDNGCGMDFDDAVLALRRHATSKIRTPEDLFGIGTLGFRGEALPSIASVSRFTLTSCTGEGSGVIVKVEGGTLREKGEVGAPKGTVIEVEDLFFNTPARRKFLKSDAAETSRISDVCTSLALAHPELRVSLTHNRNEIFTAPATEDLAERVAAVLGRKIFPKLFPVSGQQGRWKLEGMLSMPDHTRPNSTGIRLFVNGRAIQDRSLSYAVTSSYGNMLESRRFPVAILLLTLPLDEVDVNVHPTKAEVRFGDQRGVYRFLHETLREHLGAAPWIGDSASSLFSREKTPETHRPSFSGSGFVQPASGKGVEEALLAYERKRMAAERQGHFSLPPSVRQTAAGMPSTALFHDRIREDLPPEGFFSKLDVLGQIDRTYLLCRSSNGLVIVDQHAAHERVTFEKLKESYDSGSIPMQLLLLPVTVELEPARAAALDDALPALKELGFEVEPFGGRTAVIKAIPQLIANADPERTLTDLLDDLIDAGASRSTRHAVEQRLATMACHASTRAGDELNAEQIRALLQRMDRIDFAGNCPHGRPVYLEIGYTELEKRFGRMG